MASAVVTPCPAGVWTKVVDNKTSAIIHKKQENKTSFFHTYKLTGVAAPTLNPAILTNPGVKLYDDSVDYSHSAAIDIYIWCTPNAAAVEVQA